VCGFLGDFGWIKTNRIDEVLVSLFCERGSSTEGGRRGFGDVGPKLSLRIFELYFLYF